MLCFQFQYIKSDRSTETFIFIISFHVERKLAIELTLLHMGAKLQVLKALPLWYATSK